MLSAQSVKVSARLPQPDQGQEQARLQNLPNRPQLPRVLAAVWESFLQTLAHARAIKRSATLLPDLSCDAKPERSRKAKKGENREIIRSLARYALKYQRLISRSAPIEYTQPRPPVSNRRGRPKYAGLKTSPLAVSRTIASTCANQTTLSGNFRSSLSGLTPIPLSQVKNDCKQLSAAVRNAYLLTGCGEAYLRCKYRATVSTKIRLPNPVNVEAPAVRAFSLLPWIA